MDRLTGRQRAVRNAAGILLARTVVMGVGILIVPFMIARLGKQEYGLFQFTHNFLAYLPLLTLSAGVGLNRYLTHALARSDRAAVGRSLSTGFVVLLGAALALGVAGGALAALLPSLWKTLGEGVGRAQQLLLLLTAGLAVQTVAGVFRAVLFARERLAEASLIATISSFVRAAVIVGAFHAFEASLLWIGVATLLGILAESAVEAACARRMLPGFSISLRARDAAAGRELLSFSALATLGGLSNTLLLSSDNFLIQGIFGEGGPERITVYSVAAMWDPLLRGILMQLTGIVTPRMTQLAARRDRGALRDLTVLSVRYATGLVVAPCVLLAVFADELLIVWLGGSLPAEDLATAATVLRWVLATVFLQMSMNTTYGVFYATGRMGMPVAVAAVAALAKLGTSFGLAGPAGFGLPGLAAGTALAVGVSQMVVRPWLLRREIGLPVRRLLAGGLAPGFAVAIVLTLAALALRQAVAPAGTQTLVGCLGGLGLLYVLVTLGWVVLPEDRRRLRSAARRAIGAGADRQGPKIS